MPIATEKQPTALSLSSIANNGTAGKWRTEAMRSHSTPRLLFISKGQGRITVAGLTSGYGPNNLIFIPAHTMYGFEVGPTVFGQILTIPAAMAAEWPDEVTHLRLRDVMVQKELTLMFEALEKELKATGRTHSRAAHYHLGLMAVFYERQVDAAPIDTLKRRSRSSAARLVAAYTDLIERDYRSEMGVADFASVLGVTPTHLTRCCNQTCGKSALALLRDRVHFEACTLLRDTRTPINQIASQLGFASAAYFARSFAAKSGVTPSAFRKDGSGMKPSKVMHGQHSPLAPH